MTTKVKDKKLTMRILIVNTSERTGGAAVAANRLMEALKNNGFYALYDDMVLIKQALIERDRKIYGLQQHNRNLEDKLERIGGYHYGNPKQ